VLLAAAENVPLNVPLEAREHPAGKLPEATDHVYGDVPPVAESVPIPEQDPPTVPLLRLAVVMVTEMPEASVLNSRTPAESENTWEPPLELLIVAVFPDTFTQYDVLTARPAMR
jgi:hypothetical protein